MYTKNFQQAIYYVRDALPSSPILLTKAKIIREVGRKMRLYVLKHASENDSQITHHRETTKYFSLKKYQEGRRILKDMEVNLEGIPLEFDKNLTMKETNVGKIEIALEKLRKL